MADTTTTSTSTKKYNAPTGSPAMTLQGYLGEKDKLQGLLNATTGAESAATAEAGSASERAGAAAGSAVIAEGEAKAITNENALQIVKTMHGDITNPESLIAQGRVRIEQASRTKQELAAKIAEESTVAWWDDPLRYMINKVTLPVLVQAHNNANAVAKAATEEIDTLQRQIQAQQVIQPGIVADQVRIAAAGHAAALAFEGIAKGKALLAQSNGIRANALMQQMNSNDRSFQAKIEIDKMFMEQHRESEGNRQLQALLPALKRYNTIMLAMGKDETTVEEFRAMPANMKGDIIAYGQNVRKSGTFSFGDDPGDSYRQIVGRGGAATIGDTAPQVKSLIISLTRSEEFKRVKTAMSMDPKFKSLPSQEQDFQALTALATAQIKEPNSAAGQSNNKLPDSNPYKIRLGTVATFPELQNNWVSKEISTMLQKDPRAKVDEALINQLLLAKAKVYADKPGAVDKLTAEYADFFRRGSLLHWERSGAAQIGYPKPDGYGVSDAITADRGQALQTWNPADVQNYVIRGMRSNSTNLNDWLTAPAGTTAKKYTESLQQPDTGSVGSLNTPQRN